MSSCVQFRLSQPLEGCGLFRLNQPLENWRETAHIFYFLFIFLQGRCVHEDVMFLITWVRYELVTTIIMTKINFEENR